MTRSEIEVGLSRLFVDSLVRSYDAAVIAADSMFHYMFLLYVADRKRTGPEAMGELREEIMRYSLRAGRLVTTLQDQLAAAWP
jgi:hypothetical protein